MATALKDKSITDLKKLLASKREELRELRFNMSGAATRDTSVTKKLRADVARILTTLNQKDQ